mmetsp:Transcript_17343/g.37885  ORF Transcript_17343/g.37885 Transcript_17343/m.37885 type:complete len:220 (+) Transcript_17343:759-1418(+)
MGAPGGTARFGRLNVVGIGWVGVGFDRDANSRHCHCVVVVVVLVIVLLTTPTPTTAPTLIGRRRPVATYLPVAVMVVKVIPVGAVGIHDVQTLHLHHNFLVEINEGIAEGRLEQIEACPVRFVCCRRGCCCRGILIVIIGRGAFSTCTTCTTCTHTILLLGLHLHLLHRGAVLGILNELGLTTQDAAKVQTGVLGREGTAVTVKDCVQGVSRDWYSLPL